MPQGRVVRQQVPTENLPAPIRQLQELKDSGPSVFEPSLHKLARLLAQVMPTEGDPADMMNPLAGPAIGAVSAFMKPQEMSPLKRLLSTVGLAKETRVPDVVARRQATEKATNDIMSLYKNMAPAEQAKSQAILQKYPRTVAHISEVSPMGFLDVAEGKSGEVIPNAAKRPTLRLSDVGPSSQFAHVDPANSLAHELTHVAQNIGLGEHLQPLYDKADNVFGYRDNPFERSARVTGARNTQPPPMLSFLAPKAEPVLKVLERANIYKK